MNIVAGVLAGSISGTAAGAIFVGGLTEKSATTGITLSAVGIGALCGVVSCIAGLFALSCFKGIMNTTSPGYTVMQPIVFSVSALLAGSHLGAAISHFISVPALTLSAGACIGGVAGVIGGLFCGLSNAENHSPTCVHGK